MFSLCDVTCPQNPCTYLHCLLTNRANVPCIAWCCGDTPLMHRLGCFRVLDPHMKRKLRRNDIPRQSPSCRRCPPALSSTTISSMPLLLALSSCSVACSLLRLKSTWVLAVCFACSAVCTHLQCLTASTSGMLRLLCYMCPSAMFDN